MNRIDQTIAPSRTSVLMDYAELCSNIMTPNTELFDEQDDGLGAFIEECCIQDATVRIQANDIYMRFLDWYHENVGDESPSVTWFGRQLSKRFNKTKTQGVFMYHGIAMKSENAEEV
jgi:putative DNA primase/helicase